MPHFSPLTEWESGLPRIKPEVVGLYKMKIQKLLINIACSVLIALSAPSSARTDIGVYLGVAPAYAPPPVVYTQPPIVTYQSPSTAIYSTSPVYVAPPVYYGAPWTYDDDWDYAWYHRRYDAW